MFGLCIPSMSLSSMCHKGLSLVRLSLCVRHLRSLNLKNELSSLTISNAKLVNDWKNYNSLEEQLKKVNDENHKLSNEMLELRNYISKFQKGKATLDNLLESQKYHGDTQGIGYGNRTSSSSSSHINFIKSSSHSTPSSSK